MFVAPREHHVLQMASRRPVRGDPLLWIKPLFLWRLEVAEILRVPRPQIARAGPLRLDPDQQEAILHIQSHLPAGQPLYVGLSTHGLAYFNDALRYCFPRLYRRSQTEVPLIAG